MNSNDLECTFKFIIYVLTEQRFEQNPFYLHTTSSISLYILLVVKTFNYLQFGTAGRLTDNFNLFTIMRKTDDINVDLYTKCPKLQKNCPKYNN